MCRLILIYMGCICFFYQDNGHYTICEQCSLRQNWEGWCRTLFAHVCHSNIDLELHCLLLTKHSLLMFAITTHPDLILQCSLMPKHIFLAHMIVNTKIYSSTFAKTLFGHKAHYLIIYPHYPVEQCLNLQKPSLLHIIIFLPYGIVHF